MSKFVQDFMKKLNTPEYKNYFMSTHFWAPLSNYGLPLAAVADIARDPRFISGKMTFALCLYSAAFMRFAWKIKPRNLLLFTCHVINETAQLTAMVRFIKYNYSSKKQ